MARHGTRSRYVQGCHCVRCTIANREYQRRYMHDSYHKIEREESDWKLIMRQSDPLRFALVKLYRLVQNEEEA